MKDIITKPLRVYLFLTFFAILGLICGWNLPVSLFPSASQAQIVAEVPYGNLSAMAFAEQYGFEIENAIKKIKINKLNSVSKIKATYQDKSLEIKVSFEWGTDPDQAIKEVDTLVRNYLVNFEDSVKRNIQVWSWRENQGFYALSFYSPLRSLDEIYDILNPLTTSFKSLITDAERINLYNPNSQQVKIFLIPEKLAQFEISTFDIQRSIQKSFAALNGGAIKVQENYIEIMLTRQNMASNEDDNSKINSNENALTVLNRKWTHNLGLIPVVNYNKQSVLLKEIANIQIQKDEKNGQIFKTSGVESLILFASPKEGGNIKNMSDQISEEVLKIKEKIPSDIEFKVLVNPAEFINSSIQGVIKEVLISAFLAVFVLFIFIGNFKNVVTASIEIPLSLLLAFILMKLFGMNLNLISLGGLALSAGMNVDSSVVVLENIFRHFEIEKSKNGHSNNLNFNQKTDLILTAVKEVRFPIIASTIASLVVFLPLIFTQGITNSILGDLAKAVIFSHGLSAVVALVLVPTIRLHLIQKSDLTVTHSYFEPFLVKIENLYEKYLLLFIKSKIMHLSAFISVLVIFVYLVTVTVHRLPTELIGKPDSEWILVGVNAQNINTLKEIESEIDAIEKEILSRYPDQFYYTFTQINGYQNAFTMFKVKNKKHLNKLVEDIESSFKNTTTKSYWTDLWNPSELRIPEPSDFTIEVVGGNAKDRGVVAYDIQNIILESQAFERIRSFPNLTPKRKIHIIEKSYEKNVVMNIEEASHLLRIYNDGIYIEQIIDKNKKIPIYLEWPLGSKSLEDMKSIPIGFNGRVLPLGALFDFRWETSEPNLFRLNLQEKIILEGRLNKAQKNESKERLSKVDQLFNEFKNNLLKKESEFSTNSKNGIVLQKTETDADTKSSLDQLKVTVSISLVLIFFTILLQIGDMYRTLLVLVAIPTGIIGVVLSLWLFKSTLSLNSGLGVILLNGIAVANSIILVDFIYKLYSSGRSAIESTLIASKARLRPILMTSITTILGMLPVALGAGEGGKILQPLGIAVAGGLWVSMIMTLFFVPTLQFFYLSRQKSEQTVFKNKILFFCGLIFSGSFFISENPVYAKSVVTEESDISQLFIQDLNEISENQVRLQALKINQKYLSDTTLAKSFYWSPEVYLTLTQDQTQVLKNKDKNGNDLGLIKTKNDIASLNMNLNLFKAGQDLASWKQAVNSERASENKYQSEVLEFENKAAALLFKMIYLNEYINIQNQILKFKKEILISTLEKYKQGKIPLEDVQKSEIDINESESSFTKSKLELLENKSELESLYLKSLRTKDWPFKNWFTESDKIQSVLKKMKNVSNTENPIWNSKYFSIQSQIEAVNKASRSFWPSLDLSMQYQTLPIMENNYNAWNASLVLTIPIWNRYETKANWSYEKSILNTLQADFEAHNKITESKRVFLEEKLNHFIGLFEKSKKQLEKANAVYKKYEINYKLGRISINDLILEQKRLLDVETSNQDYMYQIHGLISDLCFLYGIQIQQII